MLVIPGNANDLVSVALVKNAMYKTSDMHTDRCLNKGFDNEPAMSAAQDVLIEWIDDHFLGKKVDNGCYERQMSPMFLSKFTGLTVTGSGCGVQARLDVSARLYEIFISLRPRRQLDR